MDYLADAAVEARKAIVPHTDRVRLIPAVPVPMLAIVSRPPFLTQAEFAKAVGRALQKGDGCAIRGHDVLRINSITFIAHPIVCTIKVATADLYNFDRDVRWGGWGFVKFAVRTHPLTGTVAQVGVIFFARSSVHAESNPLIRLKTLPTDVLCRVLAMQTSEQSLLGPIPRRGTPAIAVVLNLVSVARLGLNALRSVEARKTVRRRRPILCLRLVPTPLILVRAVEPRPTVGAPTVLSVAIVSPLKEGDNVRIVVFSAGRDSRPPRVRHP
mmetsp:Transcript_9023/g.26948  ORF Transcript_9023/g.26948 Transcript_9023/m.26948 type:complete len:270 (+) Transcript_9023:3563-4372(+)